MALSPEIIELATEIIDTLRDSHETLSTAESLTAGAVSSAIVTIAINPNRSITKFKKPPIKSKSPKN